MKCPFCDHDNIEGVEQCVRCDADISHIGEGDSAHDIEKDLLHRPLRAILASDFLDVPGTTTVAETIRRMTDEEYHCAIARTDGEVAGIFTERDVLYKLADGLQDREELPVGDFMTDAPETLEADDPIAFALNRMMVGGFRHIPVMEDGKMLGIVSVRDIFDYMVREFSDVLPAATGA